MTRFAADLLENAAAEGARQRRSAREQLDHWARIGCAASSRHSAARRKVEAALASELELAELGVEQGAVFNAEISTAIQEAWPMPTGEVLAGRGITTVASMKKGTLAPSNAVRSW